MVGVSRNGRMLKEMVWGWKKWLEVERNGWRLKEMVGGWKQWLEVKKMVESWKKWLKVERKDWILINMWHVCIFILTLIRKGGGSRGGFKGYKIKCSVSTSFEDKDIWLLKPAPACLVVLGAEYRVDFSYSYSIHRTRHNNSRQTFKRI